MQLKSGYMSIHNKYSIKYIEMYKYTNTFLLLEFTICCWGLIKLHLLYRWDINVRRGGVVFGVNGDKPCWSR